MLSTFSLIVNLKLRKIHTFATIKNKAVTMNTTLCTQEMF